MSSSKDELIADLKQQLGQAEERENAAEKKKEYLQGQADYFYGLLEERDAKIDELEAEREREKEAVRILKEKERSSDGFLKDTFEERDKVIEQLDTVKSAKAKLEDNFERCQEKAQQFKSDLEKMRLRLDTENTPEHLKPGPTSEQVKQLEEEWEMNRAKEDEPRNARFEELERLVLEYQTSNEAYETQIAVDASEKKRLEEVVESCNSQIEQLRGKSGRFSPNTEAHSEVGSPRAPLEKWGSPLSLSQELQLETESLDSAIDEQESVQFDTPSIAEEVLDNTWTVIPKSVPIIVAVAAQRQTTWRHFAKINIDTYKYAIHTIVPSFLKAPAGAITPSGSSLWHEAIHPFEYSKPRLWPLLFDFFLQFILAAFLYLSWEVIREKNIWIEGNDATRGYISDIYFSRNGGGIGFPRILERLGQGLVKFLEVEMETYPMPG